jgi:hypothetical protein
MNHVEVGSDNKESKDDVRGIDEVKGLKSKIFLGSSLPKDICWYKDSEFKILARKENAATTTCLRYLRDYSRMGFFFEWSYLSVNYKELAPIHPTGLWIVCNGMDLKPNIPCAVSFLLYIVAQIKSICKHDQIILENIMHGQIEIISEGFI